jgi:catechol 2,3-dioxygenase-like lactoylglutathione lyase family enzyme
MNQQLAHIALLVDDYDKAIKFYTEQLHFTLIEDTPISSTKRWVLVKPTGNGNCSILLAKATTTIQLESIGKQSGGRVFLFLYTDDFNRDYQNLLFQKIEIVRPPSNENYGIVAVFKDLYGNLWDLIQPNNLNLL